MNEIKPRLRRIRDYVNGKRGKRLLVLFRSSDGTEMIGNADDLITQRGDFLRVLSGNSLDHKINNYDGGKDRRKRSFL